MFPFRWHDEFVIPSPVMADLNVSEAVKRLAVAIEREAPKEIDRTNNCVSFRAGMFRLAFGWNILVPIGQGSVCVSETSEGLKVQYALSFREMFITVTVMMLLFFGPFIVFIARSTKSESVFVLTFGWAWLFGGNFFSSILRFQKFLRNALLNERPVQPPNLQPTAKKRGDSAAGR